MLTVLVQGVVVGAIYGLFAVGIVLVHRGSKVVNFAAPELGTFAVFLTWSMVQGLGVNWLTAAILALLATAAVSAAYERLVVARMIDAPRLAVAVSTIGLMLLLIAVELLVWDPSPRFLPGPIGGLGPQVFGVFVSPTQLISLVVVAVLGFGLTRFLRRTDFGLAVQAAAMDPVAVRLVGVRLADVSTFVWVTGGVLAGIAALLVEPTIGAFVPGFMTTAFFVPSLAAALIGGLDDVNGAFVGGIVVGILSQGTERLLLSSPVPGASSLVVFVLIVVVLLLAPSGVVAGVRDRLARNLSEPATRGPALGVAS